MIDTVQTVYRGYRFRSRTEARWAVFFDALGVPFEYEREGIDLDGVCYLPGFWLPTLKHWFEVMGEEPTAEEREKCRRLSEVSGRPVLLAVGSPTPTFSMYRWESGQDGTAELGRFRFAIDRRCEKEIWLEHDGGTGDFEGCFSLNPQPGNDHDRLPLSDFGLIAAAYRASRATRFEEVA